MLLAPQRDATPAESPASKAGLSSFKAMQPAAPAPWRKWYKTARWRSLRLEIFARDLFTCRRCPFLGTERELVCDHAEPHRGSERLFWDRANLQTLCKPCHDGAKQREEQASLHTRGVWY